MGWPLHRWMTIASVAAVGVGAWWLSGPRGGDAPDALVRLVRVAPDPDVDVVETVGGKPVEFRYQLTNLADEPLRGVHLGLNCRCQVSAPIPESIAPDETATFAFKIGPPWAGVREWSVPLAVPGQSQPLAMISGAIRVDRKPPVWMATPASPRMTAVVGDRTPSRLVWVAIEEAGSQPWLEDLAADGVPVDCEWKHSDSPLDDPQLVKRRYDITLTPGELGVGEHRGSLVVSYRTAQSPESPTTMGLALNVLPALFVRPNPCRIELDRDGVGASQVTVIDRRDSGDEIRFVADSEWLYVEPVRTSEGRISGVKLSVAAGSTAASSGRVSLLAGETQLESITVNVRLPAATEAQP
jgi:hypothetical protein